MDGGRKADRVINLDKRGSRDLAPAAKKTNTPDGWAAVSSSSSPNNEIIADLSVSKKGVRLHIETPAAASPHPGSSSPRRRQSGLEVNGQDSSAPVGLVDPAHCKDEPKATKIDFRILFSGLSWRPCGMKDCRALRHA
jgi:hypothetical protein